jgi:hypothetical protein
LLFFVTDEFVKDAREDDPSLLFGVKYKNRVNYFLVKETKSSVSVSNHHYNIDHNKVKKKYLHY